MFHGRRQVVAGLIVGFYCHMSVLVVEVDGDIHDLQQEEDSRREKVLRELGLKIVRSGGQNHSSVKLKEPGLQARLFQFLLGRRREIALQM